MSSSSSLSEANENNHPCGKRDAVGNQSFYGSCDPADARVEPVSAAVSTGTSGVSEGQSNAFIQVDT
jgi:hypothetical protein